jgi:hypothetical protein
MFKIKVVDKYVTQGLSPIAYNLTLHNFENIKQRDINVIMYSRNVGVILTKYFLGGPFSSTKPVLRCL